MIQRLNDILTKNRRFIPMAATAILGLAAYGIGAIYFDGLRNPQVMLNLFRNTSFLLMSAIGMTFVILTGGIDLSVSGVVVLSTVVSASLLRADMNPWLVILIVLAIGMTLGLIMGSFVVYLKVQPFIATLAGMWFARGMCFFISDNAINIDNRIFRILGQTRILIPGLTEMAEKRGASPPYISIPVVVAFILLAVAFYLAHYTRFGRTVYAIGGDEHSARLMGLPVNRTLLQVYSFSGFCSALAGISFALFVSSGHGLYAPGFELDVIASVVIGGTLLTGGSGYVVGTLFGVMVLAVTQALIQFIGSLSSWWTKIVIGILMLTFIGVQAILANQKVRTEAMTPEEIKRTRTRLWVGISTAVVIALTVFVILPKFVFADKGVVAEIEYCEGKPFRREDASALISEGAVIAYQRLYGPNCVDELYALFPDGRVWADTGSEIIETEIDPDRIENAVTTISEDYDWFTDEIYDTYLAPCRQCYAHYLLISYEGQEKGATTTDGTTAMPSEYGFALSVVTPLLPEEESSP